MERWPSVKQFCAWLGLAPRNDISGGKVVRSRTMKVASRANQAFRMAAQSVARLDSALGAYFRTIRARKGLQQAIVATAHKIARIVYHLLKYGEAYKLESSESYERERQERELRALTRRATSSAISSHNSIKQSKNFQLNKAKWRVSHYGDVGAH